MGISRPGTKPDKRIRFLREIQHLYLLAHIQYICGSLLSQRGGLQHQMHRLRYEHEVSPDLRMRDGHRSTGSNLFLKP